MTTHNNQSKKHNEGYFSKALPLEHNPMIGLTNTDTVSNVRDSLCALRELAVVPDFEPSERTMIGLHLLVTSMINALNFELKNRE